MYTCIDTTMGLVFIAIILKYTPSNQVHQSEKNTCTVIFNFTTMSIDTILAYTILNTPAVSTFTTKKEEEKVKRKKSKLTNKLRETRSTTV